MRPGPLRVISRWPRITRAWARVMIVAAAPISLEASAAPTTAALRLEWTAPAGCPRAEEVRAMTAALLGRSLVEDTASTRVQAQVRAVAGGYQLTIETRTPAGTDTRRLQDARCVVLAESTAMIAATAIDPSVLPPSLPPAAPELVPAPNLSVGTGVGAGSELSAGTGVEAGSELSAGTGVEGTRGAASVGTGTAGGPSAGAGGDLSSGTGQAVAASPVPKAGQVDDLSFETDARASATPTPPTPVRVALRVGGGLDLGGTPGLTGGLTIGAALLGRLWRAELYALWLAPRTRRPDPAVDVGARVGLLAGGVRGCLVPTVGRLEVPVCAGLEAGALRGRGVGDLGRVGADTLPWLAASAGPGLMWAPVRRLALTLQVDVVVPMTRTRFAVRGYGPSEGGGEVYAGAPVAARATLGLELRFR